MYAGTSNEIWKYTFNYSGEIGGLIISNLLSGVTNDSPKTEDKFGEFEPTHTYAASSGVTPGIIEEYYKDDYEYDEDGGIIFTPTSNILNMPVDQTKPINQKFSVSFTFKADLYNLDTVGMDWAPQEGGHLVSISPLVNYYVVRTSIYNGLLRVHTFGDYNGESETSVTSWDGFCSLDISKYNNKYLNVQITSEVDGKTKVYLNGNLAADINAGHYSGLSYDFCTIGDLRPGRGYKLRNGTVYNFALYGDILTDEQIVQNWNYVKNELGINEAGEKVTNE